MKKVVRVYLPTNLISIVEKNSSIQSIKEMIYKHYPHVLNICRNGYDFNFEYCSVSKSILIEVTTEDKVFFMDF